MEGLLIRRYHRTTVDWFLRFQVAAPQSVPPWSSSCLALKKGATKEINVGLGASAAGPREGRDRRRIPDSRPLSPDLADRERTRSDI
jgi:hypothetical protein